MVAYYDSRVYRQFNMLGSYIEYYDKLVENSATEPLCRAQPSMRSLPPDCIGYAQEPTKGSEDTLELFKCCRCDDESSSESSSDGANDSNDTYKLEGADASVEQDLLDKLREAEYTILSMQEHCDRLNRDHFDVEQIMKKTYYEDNQRSRLECSRLQSELEQKEQQLFELMRHQEMTDIFLDDRQREMNELMNDVILNVKDMSRYQVRGLSAYF
ncbi:ATPase AAA, putative [Babesia ovata]|uniref:ATPase AAA, putative n=1 Tax=Babesia ovata TaxID=189622 RepID=A0A2H6KCE4_9APIC|nr:ATPase AAA, putative [Babesia ovata]GBE60629.1 ATPase AAA, putative [Babesia ovata]